MTLMELGILLEIGVLLVLVLANGVLAGAEIAIVAMRPSRVRELAGAGRRGAVALQALRRVPERFLSTIQIGITVIGATAGAFGGATFAGDLQPWVARVPGLAEHARPVALGLAIGVISYLSVVLGELVPKSLALRTSERYALLVARPLRTLSWIARPMVWLLTASSNAVLRLFGDRTSFTESRLSLEELRSLVDEARREGAVDWAAGEIAARALEFSQLSASDVMIHRRFVVGLPRDAGAEEVERAFRETGHQRLLVYGESVDELLGYAHWRDVLTRAPRDEPLDLPGLLRPCHFVPETMPAPALLEEMRAQRLQLAVVVDEHGGTAGIVTLEDLLEEFVGEITSEREALPPEAVHREPDGSAVVLGTAPLRDVNRELGLDLEEPPGQTTVAGLCIDLADGRIPQRGEVLAGRDGTRIEVLDASVRRVRRVRVHAAEPSRAEGDPGTA